MDYSTHDMNYRTWIGVGLLGALLVGLAGCAKPQDSYAPSSKSISPQTPPGSFTKTINNREYRFEAHKIAELTPDPDSTATFGVLSDIHGEVERTKKIAELFQKRSVEAILVPGDLARNEPLRYGKPDLVPDKAEITEVLKALAGTGLPIYAIPGNHERKADWEAALQEVTSQYPNVIDMTQYRVVDGDDADIVSLPGYQTKSIPDRQFIPDDGYWASPDKVRELTALRRGLDDAVILLTHGAGRTNAVSGPATIANGQDVGDALTAEVMKQANIPFAAVGHIHEAGGLAATWDGTAVNPGAWAPQFTVNAGTLEDWTYLDGKEHHGTAVILTVEGKQAKFEKVELE